jgi:hypothetical protein
MARFHSSLYEQVSNDILDRVTISSIGDNEVEGGGVVWVADTDIRGSIDSITVLDYDQSRHSCYDKHFKPHVIIKNNQNCSVNNMTVKDFAGNTLFTFAADNSATPAYCVLRLTTARAWELA